MRTWTCPGGSRALSGAQTGGKANLVVRKRAFSSTGFYFSRKYRGSKSSPSGGWAAQMREGVGDMKRDKKAKGMEKRNTWSKRPLTPWI